MPFELPAKDVADDRTRIDLEAIARSLSYVESIVGSPGGSGGSVGGLLPPGAITMWAAASPPGGWYKLDGVSIAPAVDNPTLASYFGVTGANVNLPNLSGRVPLGIGTASPAVVGGTAHTLAQKGGQETVLLTDQESGLRGHSVSVSGSANGGSHHHQFAYGNNVLFNVGTSTISARPAVPSEGMTLYDTTDTDHSHSVSASGSVGAANAAQDHENLPPYYALNYIIKGG